MRSLISLVTALALLASVGVASAKDISAAESAALSAQNSAAISAMESQNIANDKTGVNPWGTPAAIEYIKNHPYDTCDVVRGKDGFVIPGWQSTCGNGEGGDAGASVNMN